MKKKLLTLALGVVATGAAAQHKFEVKDFGTFKLHSYMSADPLGDMNYIIEGSDALVILEPAVFHENIKEFTDYTASLRKPVVKVIANYHAGGFKTYDGVDIVMVDGMPEFSQGEVYSSMMGGFAQAFGDTIDTSDGVHTTTVSFNSSQTWADVTFEFLPGATSDFPAASILIGKKVYYTHFTPAVAHFSPLQITGKEAVDAQLTELENAKRSGAVLFIGGHGQATAGIAAVDFQIGYLKKVKQLLSSEDSAGNFSRSLISAFPGIPGEENVSAVVESLYK